MKILLDRENLVFNPPDLGCVLSLSGLPGGDSKIYDRSSYGNTGTITGAIWVRLPSGLWCQYFDGADDGVVIPRSTSFEPATAITFELWVNRDGNNGNLQSLLSNQDYSPAWGYHFGVQNSAGLMMFIYIDGGWRAPEVGTLRDGIWEYAVGTYDGADTKLYINTVERRSDSQTGDITYSGDNPDLGIGQGMGRYKGYIALPRIYNRALSDFEIRRHFDQEKSLFGVW